MGLLHDIYGLLNATRRLHLQNRNVLEALVLQEVTRNCSTTVLYHGSRIGEFSLAY
jgi:hypothetical protein